MNLNEIFLKIVSVIVFLNSLIIGGIMSIFLLEFFGMILFSININPSQPSVFTQIVQIFINSQNGLFFVISLFSLEIILLSGFFIFVPIWKNKLWAKIYSIIFLLFVGLGFIFFLSQILNEFDFYETLLKISKIVLEINITATILSLTSILFNKLTNKENI